MNFPNYSVDSRVQQIKVKWQRQHVLKCLPSWGNGEHGLTAREIADAVGMDYSTVYRRLKSLKEHVTRRKDRYWKMEKWQAECPSCSRQFWVRNRSLKLPSHKRSNMYGQGIGCLGSGQNGRSPFNPNILLSRN